MTQKPIGELLIRHEKTEGGYSELKVLINQDGALVLDGCDAGESVRKQFGDWDFEYWLTVPKDYKDSVLLHLLKDRFTSVHDLQAWLKERGIPCDFTSYT